MKTKRRSLPLRPDAGRFVTACALAALLCACAGDGGSDSGTDNGRGNGGVPGDATDNQPFAEIGEHERVNFGGTEPFWGGSVVSGQLIWTTPENISGTAIEVTRFAGRGGLSFSGTLDQRSLDLTITPGECSDGMSDRTYPLVVTVSLGNEILNGCAWRDSDDLGPAP